MRSTAPPIDRVLELPAFRRLGPPETGALAQIALHYWQGECEPLPTDDKGLQRLAKAHPRSWHQYRARVLNALPRVLELLDGLYRAHSTSRANNLQHLARVRLLIPPGPRNKKQNGRKPAAFADAGNVTDTLLAPVRAPVEKPARTVDGRPIPARVARSGHAPPTLSE